MGCWRSVLILAFLLFSTLNACGQEDDYDQDGVADGKDNCPGNYNPWQEDSDGNGVGDACETKAADSDGDGVQDGDDECPGEYGSSKYSGCPEPATTVPAPADSDGDGVSDSKDSCPHEYGDPKNNGCPVISEELVDSDKDGVADVKDNCPAVSNKGQSDADKDGVGDACDSCDSRDSDADNVPNCDDQCPNEPGPKSNGGCPEKRSSKTVVDYTLSRGLAGYVVTVKASDPSGIRLISIFADNTHMRTCLETDACEFESGSLNPNSRVGAAVLNGLGAVAASGSVPSIAFNASVLRGFGASQEATPTMAFNRTQEFLGNRTTGRDSDWDGVDDGSDRCDVTRVCSGSSLRQVSMGRASCRGVSMRFSTENLYHRRLYNRTSLNGCGCLDTDGWDYFMAGEVYTEYVDREIDIAETRDIGVPPIFGCVGVSNCEPLWVDECLDSRTLREYVCGQSPESVEITCTAGCRDGACICPDTDGGRNYYQSGTLLGRADACLDQDSLLEFYCGIDKNAALTVFNVTFRCEAGCSNGACICTDTDGGINVDVRGSVGRFTDTCVGNYGLTEYYVNPTPTSCNLRTRAIVCDSRECRDGACQPPSCYDGIQNQGEAGTDCGGPCQACGDMMLVAGTVKYQEADTFYHESGLTLGGYKPARHIYVYVESRERDDAEEPLYFPGRTDSRGEFRITVPRSSVGDQFRIKLVAENQVANVQKDYDSCNEYVWFESPWYRFNPRGNVNLGDMFVNAERGGNFTGYWSEDGSLFCDDEINRINGGSAYFNIAEGMLLGYEYAQNNRGDTDSIGIVDVAYPDPTGSDGQGGALTSGIYDEIYLPGRVEFYHGADAGFRDKAILHEYAHHLTGEISTFDLHLSSDHDFCLAYDGEMAWSEGFAEYFAYLLINKYRNDSAKYLSLSEMNYHYPEIERPACSGGGDTDKEGYVHAVLWDLVDRPGPEYLNSTNEAFDNMNGYERQIFQVFDTELDTFADAGDICEFMSGSGGQGFIARVGRKADVDRILAANGMSGASDMTSCSGGGD